MRAVDAGEIVVLADIRHAELEAEEKAGRNRVNEKRTGNSGVTRDRPLPKRELVAESRRAPLLVLPEKDRDQYFAACRKALVPPTSMGAAERAEHLARRKEIYETLHPEAKHGAAAKANISARTVRREVQIAEQISADVRDTLRAPAGVSSFVRRCW